jgi:diguanylate cyclase (GGDEF)-like protein
MLTNVIDGMRNILQFVSAYLPPDMFVLISIISLSGIFLICSGIYFLNRGSGIKSTVMVHHLLRFGILLYVAPFLFHLIIKFPQIPQDYRLWSFLPSYTFLMFVYTSFPTLWVGGCFVIGVFSIYAFSLEPITNHGESWVASWPTRREVLRYYRYNSKARAELNIFIVSLLITITAFLLLAALIYGNGYSLPNISYASLVLLVLAFTISIYFIFDSALKMLFEKAPRTYETMELTEDKGLLKKRIATLIDKLSYYFEETKDFFTMGYLVMGDKVTKDLLVVPRKRGKNVHTGIWGPPGASKTEGFVYPSLLADIWHSDRSIFLLDNKSPEMFNRVAGAAFKNNMRVIFFDPWQPQYCPRFNPLAGVGNDPANIDRHINLLCDILLGTTTDISSIGNESERFFKARARQFMELLFLLVFSFPEKERTLPKAYEIIDSIGVMSSFIKKYASSTSRIGQKWQDFEKVDNSSKANILIQTRDALSIFSDPHVKKAFSGSDFTLDMLYDKDVRTLLIIGCPFDEGGGKSAVLASLFTKLMINLAFTETRSSKSLEMRMAAGDEIITNDIADRIKSKRGLVLNFEEGDTISIEELPDILRVSRYTNVQINYIGQDPTTLASKYKDWKSIETTIATRFYAGGLSNTTTKDLSEKVGQTIRVFNQVTEKSFFVKGMQLRPSLMDLMPASQIYHLPDNRFLVFPTNKLVRPFIVETASIHGRNPHFVRKQTIPLPNNPPIFKPDDSGIIDIIPNSKTDDIAYKDSSTQIESARAKKKDNGDSSKADRSVNVKYYKKNKDVTQEKDYSNVVTFLPDELKSELENIKSNLIKKEDLDNVMKIVASLQSEVMYDALTKLYNRRTFDNRIAEEIARFERHETPFSLFVIDIDRFKKFNDDYGHQKGDEVLQHVAEVVKNNLRVEDIPCRYGGEEFVIIFPETKEEGAYKIADKLRNMIESLPIPNNGSNLKVTISGGVVEMKKGYNGKTLFEEADKLLYKAKEDGRNKVYALGQNNGATSSNNGEVQTKQKTVVFKRDATNPPEATV